MDVHITLEGSDDKVDLKKKRLRYAEKIVSVSIFDDFRTRHSIKASCTRMGSVGSSTLTMPITTRSL